MKECGGHIRILNLKNNPWRINLDTVINKEENSLLIPSNDENYFRNFWGCILNDEFYSWAHKSLLLINPSFLGTYTYLPLMYEVSRWKIFPLDNVVFIIKA